LVQPFKFIAYTRSPTVNIYSRTPFHAGPGLCDLYLTMGWTHR